MAIIIECEMPSYCGVCHECDFSEVENRNYCAVDGKFRTLEPPRPADCPIVGEIPGKHGRLIDADELIKALKDHASPSGREWYYAEVSQIINEAPTILEANT